MKSQLRFISLLAGAALALSTHLAHADIVITQTPGNVPGVDTVIFNACSGTETGPALTVQGCLSSSQSTIVDFTSDENLVAGGAGVQADVDTFDSMRINVNPLLTSSFTTLIFNLDVADDPETNGPDEGQVVISVQPIGEPLFVSTPFDIASNGQNFFRIQAINGEAIQFVDFLSTIQLDEIQSIRIGGIPGVPSVPEPGTIMLLGLGVIALGVGARRKMRV